MAEGKKPYVTPTIEITDKPDNNFFVRLCYGYVEGTLGEDTSKMTTRQVVQEFLDAKGVSSPKEFFDKKFKGQDKKQKDKSVQPESNIKEQEIKPLEREPYKEALDKMINDDSRIGYARVITKKKLKQNIELGQNGMGEMTVHLFNEDSFGMAPAKNGDEGAYFSPSRNCCVWKTDYFTSDEIAYLEKGEGFYHECWHAIDNNYGDSLYVDRYGSPDSSSYLSSSYKLSSGKAFAQTLVEEYKSSDKQAEMRADMQTDIDNYWQSVYGMSKEELRQRYHNARAKGRQMVSDEKWDEYFAYNDSEEMKEIRDAYFDTLETYPKGIKKKWGSLSDVVSGATDGRESLCQIGHFDMSYWTETNRGTEFFAEIASAKATNKASYEMIKKHFPKTVEAFDELYNGLLSGKIKSRGRFKYEK